VEKKVFICPIKAMGKQRPGFNSHTKHAYTQTKTRDFEDKVRAYYLSQFTEEPSYEGAIVLKITVNKKPAESFSEKKKQAMMGMPCTIKPDWDNIGKIVCDALNGYAYKDDKQVYNGQVIKTYGNHDQIIVEIEYE